MNTTFSESRDNCAHRATAAKNRAARICLDHVRSLAAILLVAPVMCSGQTADLTVLSLEDLSNVKVSSVSRKTETLFAAPGAIFVLTAEDIRRGGFTSLPEALRMVPGLYVVKINPHAWQISARGFSDFSNNKMLVLVDGRTVYTPLYGGVYWDALDTPLEDIDRIEVIRGPGGTLWGANAVNGVINIVTKTAQRSAGWLVSTAADLNVGYKTTIQYGGQAGPNLNYRIFARSSYAEPSNSASGGEQPNNFNLTQAGLRADWKSSSQDVVSLQAGAYQGSFRSTFYPTPRRVTDLLKGNNVLLSWKHAFSSDSKLEVLTYCDWYTRQGTSGEMRNRCDLEFQHSWQFKPRHAITWGGSYLTTGDNVAFDSVPLIPMRRRTGVVSAFAQYELIVVPQRLKILGGAKVEHNDYSGFEYQPQVRAVWTPNPLHTVWGSVARAVRTPNREESDLYDVVVAGFANGAPYYLLVAGNHSLQSERLKAYEVGYRYQPQTTLYFDLALFYNDYTNLITGTAVQPIPDTNLLGTVLINSYKAQTHGGELSAKWQPVRRWSLSTGVAELRGSLKAANANPHHLLNVQSRLDLPRRWEFDGGFYHYSALPVQAGIVFGIATAGVPSFNRIDLGMVWRATPQWRFAVWGRNLQSAQHVESLPTILAGPATEVPRSVSFQIVWQQKDELARP